MVWIIVESKSGTNSPKLPSGSLGVNRVLMRTTEEREMTVQTLIRELEEFNPKHHVCVDAKGTLYIGKDYMLSLPDKQDRAISRMHEENNGLDGE